jgi:hypothetical protein
MLDPAVKSTRISAGLLLSALLTLLPRATSQYGCSGRSGTRKITLASNPAIRTVSIVLGRVPTKRDKGTKWMVTVDGAGTPLGAYLDAASPAEVTLLEQTLASQPIRGKPNALSAIAVTVGTCAASLNDGGFSRSFPLACWS